MPLIIVHSWKAVEKLTPIPGAKVVVKNRSTGVIDGEFVWVNMWNPYTWEFQVIRA